jgi:hypothetical protein
MTPSTRRSDSLHTRVQAFIHASAVEQPTAESFDSLACDLARHQASNHAGIERLLAAAHIDAEGLQHASQIPAIPTDAFKFRRIACHAPSADQVVFQTSGTTVGGRGQHALRRTDTYEASAIAWARRLLFPDVQRLHFVLLAPRYDLATDSSLGFMLDRFSRRLGLTCTWAVESGALQLDAIRSAVGRATEHNQPVCVAGASFAFVHLLDLLGSSVLLLPACSRVMQTGGFKGRSRTIAEPHLREQIGRAFGVPEDLIVGEYGMTELSSQAYEATLLRALGTGPHPTDRGVYVPPPWMRVTAVDPESLLAVDRGHLGVARIEDLANVDSAVAIQTADQIREADTGFVVMGRTPDSSPRGCSIGMDELLGAR